jgi:hypothetical protein
MHVADASPQSQTTTRLNVARLLRLNSCAQCYVVPTIRQALVAEVMGSVVAGPQTKLAFGSNSLTASSSYCYLYT